MFTSNLVDHAEHLIHLCCSCNQRLAHLASAQIRRYSYLATEFHPPMQHRSLMTLDDSVVEGVHAKEEFKVFF